MDLGKSLLCNKYTHTCSPTDRPSIDHTTPLKSRTKYLIMFEIPLTLQGICAQVPKITSFLPWKRPVSNLKKVKSLRLGQRSSSHRLNGLSREPSLPRRKLPPLIPRKRAHNVLKQPSIVRQRAAAMRGKRVEALRASNTRKKDLVTPPTPPVGQPAPEPMFVQPSAEVRLRRQAAQQKLDGACNYAQRTGPRPRTLKDAVFVEQMAKMNFRHRFLTERFKARAQLDEAQDRVEERKREQVEHDRRAEELRAKKAQQQHRSNQQPYPQPRQHTAAAPAQPSPPRFFRQGPPPPPPPPPSESLRREWAHQNDVFQADAEWRAHQARIKAGEIPPNTRLPVKGEWSIWEKVRVGMDRIYQEVDEAQKMRERQAKEERIRREEELRRAAWAKQAEARAQEERMRKLNQEQQAQARLRAAWEEKVKRETALAAELRAAEEEKARVQAAAAAAGMPARPASIPFIPPQTNDPELYRWEIYDRRWAAIKREGVEVVPFPLRFDQVPWPMFYSKPTMMDIDDLSETEISHFVLNSRRPGFERKSAKERLRYELLHYHPDKFNARVLPYVLEEERQKVVEGATKVTVILHNLLRYAPA
ncbi:hypothetical protein EV361DRAFT_884864 [Lentinula raphanica]|nr:hypothetical protein EV361DRAFT_884864 [Lentinula raphanica]